MKILNPLSFVFGYKFFENINSIISYLISASLNRKLKEVGKFARFKYPTRAVGLENISIGDNFSSGKGLRIQAIKAYGDKRYDPEIIIGNDVTINPNSQIVSINKIKIGDNVLIASNVFISDHSHGVLDFSDIDVYPSKRALDTKGEINIGNNVWIGQNVSILANVTIGENSIIGANSVVTRDIPSYCIAVGSPAKVIKHLKADDK